MICYRSLPIIAILISGSMFEGILNIPGYACLLGFPPLMRILCGALDKIHDKAQCLKRPERTREGIALLSGCSSLGFCHCRLEPVSIQFGPPKHVAVQRVSKRLLLRPCSRRGLELAVSCNLLTPLLQVAFVVSLDVMPVHCHKLFILQLGRHELVQGLLVKA